jgi:hypothetical protein
MRTTTTLSTEEVNAVLSVLCRRLGFCLSSDADARLAEDPPSGIDEFTAAVFIAEGLDPSTADRRVYRQVKAIVADAFRSSEERRSSALTHLD